MAGEDQAKFAVVLEDKTSGAAASAAQALEKLQGAIKRDTQELAAMQSAMKRMQQGTSVNVEAFRELQGKIEAQKNKIAEAQARFVSLGGQFGRTSKSTKGAADRMKELGDKARQLPGPIGKLGGGIADMAGKMGTGSMVALGLAAAFVAVGAAVLGAMGSMISFGIQAGNARRNQELHFEAISRMRRGLVGMRASAGEVMGAIDQVAGSTATSREQVARFAEILQRGGVRGNNLSVALRAASIKAAALGDEAGASFAQLAVGASRAGGSINRLADDVNARFGRIAARRMLDLNVMLPKLRENFASIFDGLNLEPLLGVFHAVVGFFSQSTATGRALKEIVTALFQPMIDSAGGATPIIKRFFQGIVIAALHTTIAILRVKRWFNETFSGSVLGRLDSMKVALYAGGVAFGVLAVAAGAAFGVMAALALAVVAPFALIGAAIYGAVRLFRAAGRMFSTLVADWREIGAQLVSGLVNGIRNGINAAKNAVRDLGNGIVEEWRSLLDIHSPSRVFAGLGEQIPAGVAVGVDRGSARADAAVSDMINVPSAIGQAGGGGSVSVSIGDIHVNGGNSAEIAQNLRDAIARELESLALVMGGRIA